MNQNLPKTCGLSLPLPTVHTSVSIHTHTHTHLVLLPTVPQASMHIHACTLHAHTQFSLPQYCD